MQLKGIVVGALVLSVSACSTTKASTVAPSSSMEETKRLLDACNTSLEDAQHRLADYGNQQDKNAISMSYYKRRMQAYKDIADRLRGIFTPDKLKIEIRDGLLVVQMPEPVLFGPGQFKLHAGGESTLREMEPVLQSLPKREFLVSGYTDDVPVKKDNSAYQDNWELSALRALAVVRYLRQLGLTPKSIAAAGFGKYHPIADNATEAGRAENRRIEIVFLPTVEELPKLPPS